MNSVIGDTEKQLLYLGHSQGYKSKTYVSDFLIFGHKIVQTLDNVMIMVKKKSY